MKTDIQSAKNSLRIPDLWKRLGLAGTPNKSCLCPFHNDSNPSFSIFSNGLAWKCFSGCGQGDAINLIEKALNLGRSKAVVRFLELARIKSTKAKVSKKIGNGDTADVGNSSIKDVSMGTMEQWEHLADLRNVGVEAIKLMAIRGLLGFQKYKGTDAWLVGDSTGNNSQARRMDGMIWEKIKAKAWTVYGSKATWPVGIHESQPFPNLILVEGGPDLLAAHHFIWCEDRESDCAAVAMLGASMKIQTNALGLFSGKRVRIFGHTDEAGIKAVNKWSSQLIRVGAKVDAFNLEGLQTSDGNQVNDLNDLCSIHADVFEAEIELRRILP